jgi:hypothetical protein
MCPNKERIEALLRGEGSREEQNGFRRHARQCEKCRDAATEIGERLLLEQVALGGGHPDATSLSRFLDGKAPGHAEPLVALHVDSCTHCAERLETMRRGRVASTGLPAREMAYEPVLLPSPPLSRDGFRRVNRTAVAAAAFFTLAVVAAVGYRQVMGGGPSPLRQGSTGPTVAGGVKNPGIQSKPTAVKPILIGTDGAVRIAKVDGAVQFEGADTTARSLYSALWRDGRVTLPEGASPRAIRTLGPAGPDDRQDEGFRPASNSVLINPTVDFQWAGAKTGSYTVEVYAADQKLKPLRVTKVRGTKASIVLPAGKEYTYIVLSGVQEVVPETGFRLVDHQAEEEIAHVEKLYPQSHLLLASVYAKHGLSAQARDHLSRYVRSHPKDPVAIEISRQLDRE